MEEKTWKKFIDVCFLFILTWRLIEGKTWQTLDLPQHIIYPVILLIVIIDLYDILKQRRYVQQIWSVIFDSIYIFLFVFLCIKSLI